MSEGQAAARCGECGMDCQPDEYHPYLACLAFKQTHDSDCVRANVESVRRAAQAAVWREAQEAARIHSHDPRDIYFQGFADCFEAMQPTPTREGD